MPKLYFVKDPECFWFLLILLLASGCSRSQLQSTRNAQPIMTGRTGTPCDNGTFDPTGRYVATAKGNWIDIWESSSGSLYRSIKLSDASGPVTLWFRSSKTIDLIAGKVIYSYSLTSVKLVHTKRFPSGSALSDFGANNVQGNYMLTYAQGNKKLEVWNLRDQSFQTVPNKYLYYGLLSTGKRLVAIRSGDMDKFYVRPTMAYLIDVPSGKVAARTRLDTAGDFEYIGCSPDSSFCLIGLPNGKLEKWDFRSPARILGYPRVTGFGVSPSDIQVSPDSKYAAFSVVSPNGEEDIIDCSTGNVIGKCIKNVNDGWNGAAFSPNSSRLLIGDPSGAAIYRVSDHKKLIALPISTVRRREGD